MWSFLAEFTKNTDGVYTVVVMDERGVDQPRRYEVQPRRVLTLWGSSVLVVSLLAVSLVAFTPIRQLIPGYGTEEIRQAARINDQRVAALSDSLEAQQRYIEHLRGLITGEVDTSAISDIAWPNGETTSPPASSRPVPAASDDWRDHQQPAMPAVRQLAGTVSATTSAGRQEALGRVQLPMRPPVEGFPTRGFDARAGHYAVDIAVESGTPVRCVGDGYIILSDWTQEGGYTVAVQHANGYVSVYKHNKRLLKRVGDRVRSRETIAISGNTGEITTGPHLHFEFWRNGLAQDPSQYFVGW